MSQNIIKLIVVFKDILKAYDNFKSKQLGYMR